MSDAAWFKSATENFALLGECCQAALDLATQLAGRVRALEDRLGADPGSPPPSPAPADGGAALIAARQARQKSARPFRPRSGSRTALARNRTIAAATGQPAAAIDAAAAMAKIVEHDAALPREPGPAVPASAPLQTEGE